MDINTLMTQLMGTQMLMKPDQSIYQMIIGLIIMQIMGVLPIIRDTLMKYISKEFNARKNDVVSKMNEITIGGKENIKTASIIYYKRQKEDSLHINAINDYISIHNNAVKLGHALNYMVTNKNVFDITYNIKCQVVIGDLGNPASEEITYTVELFSYNLQLEDLRQFVTDLIYKYNISINNKLGAYKYFFTEHQQSDQHKMTQYTAFTSNLIFTLTKFNTNKNINNVFGKHLDILKDRIDMFMNNEDWYKERGIPHTLGILLYGPPGTGKTSSIKALAKTTGRHIFNISLNKTTTKTQLHNLFFNDVITVLNTHTQKNEQLTIPTTDRIYVFEDIDVISNIVHEPVILTNNDDTGSDNDLYNELAPDDYGLINDIHQHQRKLIDNKLEPYRGSPELNRQYSHPPKNNTHTLDNFKINISKEDNFKINATKEDINSDPLTLAFLLNLFDGILETPGRIMFMTTNHPDKLSKALIRPGRIDVQIEVGYCDVDMIKDIYNFFYKTNHEFTNFIINKPLIPAKITQICMNHYNDPLLAYDNLLIASS